MDTTPEWYKQGFLNHYDYETRQIANFVEQCDWSEVSKRPDLFDRILGLPKDEFTPANMINLDRMMILDDLFKDIRKIPKNFYSATVINLGGVSSPEAFRQFQRTTKELYPGIEFKEKFDLNDLLRRAKLVSNGLSNVYKINSYRIAEKNFSQIQVLKQADQDQLQALLDEQKEIEDLLADNVKAGQPLAKETLIKITEFLKKSGRTNLEIQDLSEEEDLELQKAKLAGILRQIREAVVIVRQAQKDRVADQLDKIEIVAQELERFQDEDLKRFFKHASEENADKNPTAETGTPPES